MKYSAETLKKLSEVQNATIAHIIADGLHKYHVRIMPKNQKVPCPNFGTCPVRNCVNCASCIQSCYVIKAAMRFPWAPWDTYMDENGIVRHKPGTMFSECVNAAIYENDVARFWDEIAAALARQRSAYMRGWESGDNGTVYDVDRQNDMARRNDDKLLWSYTKTWDVVNEWIDENGPLADNNKIMFSIPFGMEIDTFNAVHNPHGLATFYVARNVAEFKAAVARGYMPCPGDCQKCIDGKRGCVAGQNVVCMAH